MVQIEYLADFPQAIPILARWHNAQWGYHDPADSVAGRIQGFAQHLQKKAIPTTFVAVEEGRVLGSASLIEKEDLDSHSHLTPWLASVYVDETERGRGIGSLLAKRVMLEAREIGVKTLYLYTPDREAFYGRMGWKPIQRTSHHTERGEESITVMSIDASSI